VKQTDYAAGIGETRLAYKATFWKLHSKGPYENLEVHERIILKWISD
jgi:hypothetical protein